MAKTCFKALMRYMSLGKSLETGSGVTPDIHTSCSALCLQRSFVNVWPNVYSLYYAAFISGTISLSALQSVIH